MRVYVLYPHSLAVLMPLFALWLGIIVVGCVRVLPQWGIACPMTDKVTKKVGSVFQQCHFIEFDGCTICSPIDRKYWLPIWFIFVV